MKNAEITIHDGGKRIAIVASFIPASAAELEHLRQTIEEHKLCAVATPPEIVEGELKLRVEFIPFGEVVKMMEKQKGLNPAQDVLSPEDAARLAAEPPPAAFGGAGTAKAPPAKKKAGETKAKAAPEKPEPAIQ